MIIRDSREKLEKKAAEIISSSIKRIGAEKERVLIAVPGGRSVSGIFNILRSEDIDWKKVHIFIMDERFVPLDHKDSNYKLAYDGLIKHLFESGKIHPNNVHCFRYTGDIEADMKAYERELVSLSDRFDIVLLSSGDDGHVACLYPNHETVNSLNEYFIYTLSSPWPPAERITSSRKLIQKADTSVILFFGENKRQAFQNYTDSNLKVEDCPIKIANEIKNIYVLVY